MKNVTVYNQKNESVKEIATPADIFGVAWNNTLVKQVLDAQMSNRRRPWAHAKGRSEVRGGGRKPWRQKGTGRARHGSIRSPLWSGGGKAHGPNKERDYTQKVNKKMRRVAIFSVLSKKLKDDQIKFFDTFEMTAPKTKTMESGLRVALNMTPKSRKFDVLMIPAAPMTPLARAVRNLTKTKVLPATSLNVYDLMNYKNIMIEEKAIEVIANRYKI
ncbi:MAG: 50S ribosomal protein L4 [Patescibacteria group bacterium]